ncbi:MAG: phage tail tube protein [bacterium]|nr:phage tail tube protein [bacterium]
MTIAQGVSKQAKMKEEVDWGVVPAAAGSKALRRVTLDVSLKKDTYESKEIRTDAQVVDMRHGMRKVEGSLKSEVNPGDQAPFIAGILRRDFTAGKTTGAASISVVADGYVRAAGSFITDGFQVGSVVRAVGLVNAANNGSNFFVTEVTALKLKGLLINGDSLVVEAAAAGVVLTEPGKRTFVPKTGHTRKSWSMESWYSDVLESEVYTGLKATEASYNLPATGMAEFEVKFLGKDVKTAKVEYFTNPIEAGTTAALAAVNGVVVFGGTRMTLATALQLNINGNASTEAVIGSNSAPEIFSGRVTVSGTASVFFQDGVERDKFLNETEAPVFCVFTSSSAKDADFVAITLPRVKYSSADKDDGEKGLIQTIAFTALRGIGVNQENTTIAVQDTQA